MKIRFGPDLAEGATKEREYNEVVLSATFAKCN